MPTITRWYVKSSLVYLVAALLLGTGVAARSAGLVSGLPAGLEPVYWHLLMVGFITQLIFGVAYWMFPKGAPERLRGRDSLAVLSYICLNSGLVLRAVGEPAATLSPGLGWLLALSAVLQWIAGTIFVVNTWGRVRGK